MRECSWGHGECNFDNVVEKIATKGENFSLNVQKFWKEDFLQVELVFMKMLSQDSYKISRNTWNWR